MGFTVDDVIDRLELEGVRLDRALTEADLRRIEKRYHWTFGPDQRALLRTNLPSGDAWMNWRHATPAKVQERLQLPIDVARTAITDGFWAGAWGSPPTSHDGVREQLTQAPSLVPLYGPFYLPSEPALPGSPVFRVEGGQVTNTRLDLLAWVAAEVGGETAERPHDVLVVEFWSELAARDWGAHTPIPS